MKFQSSPNRVVNRFGISVYADSNGIIETENTEMIDLLKNGYKFPVVGGKVETEAKTEQVETSAETESPKRGRKAS